MSTITALDNKDAPGDEMRSPSPRTPRLFAFVGYVVVSVAAGLILLELLCWLGWSGYHWFHPRPALVETDSPAYAGASWVRDLNREQGERLESHSEYVPFRLWGLSEWHGKYMNVDSSHDGVWRRTLNPSTAECKNRPETTVWVFGGSTVFGTGVPDWATLPSYLSRNLNSAGRDCVEVTNFGVEGYVTTQEVILLTEQLKEGRHPAILIFYDGFNDAFVGMNAADPRMAHYSIETIKARVEGSFRGRFDFIERLYSLRVAHAVRGLFRGGHAPVPDYRNAKAIATMDNFEANLKIVDALSKAYGFKVYFFLQPTVLYGNKPLVPFEQQIARRNGPSDGRVMASALTAVYEEAERRGAGSPEFVNLSRLFDSSSEALYLDEVHLGPRGNELAANAIAKYIQGYPDGMAVKVEPPRLAGQAALSR